MMENSHIIELSQKKIVGKRVVKYRNTSMNLLDMMVKKYHVLLTRLVIRLLINFLLLICLLIILLILLLNTILKSQPNQKTMSSVDKKVLFHLNNQKMLNLTSPLQLFILFYHNYCLLMIPSQLDLTILVQNS